MPSEPSPPPCPLSSVSAVSALYTPVPPKRFRNDMWRVATVPCGWGPLPNSALPTVVTALSRPPINTLGRRSTVYAQACWSRQCTSTNEPTRRNVRRAALDHSQAERAPLDERAGGGDEARTARTTAKPSRGASWYTPCTALPVQVRSCSAFEPVRAVYTLITQVQAWQRANLRTPCLLQRSTRQSGRRGRTGRVWQLCGGPVREESRKSRDGLRTAVVALLSRSRSSGEGREAWGTVGLLQVGHSTLPSSLPPTDPPPPTSPSGLTPRLSSLASSNSLTLVLT